MSLSSVLERVEKAAAQVGRDPSLLTVVVVSKGHSVGEVSALYRAGHRDFGENRAQELASKVGHLPTDIRWHFVGPLQTNKVRLVRPIVTLLHSLDREALGQAWMKGPGLPPPALLQVNIGRELQKHGVSPEDAPSVVDRLLGMAVPLQGVMAIPPAVDRPEAARPYFRSLNELARRLRSDHPALVHVSMGMTDDFEVAVQEGATMIRVGRAIFAGTAN
ncbi:MAG: YggS family pyridoxal phosphate-dependent enzyme [Actinomycetota bacterium]